LRRRAAGRSRLVHGQVSRGRKQGRSSCVLGPDLRRADRRDATAAGLRLLICVGDPRKGGILGRFVFVGLISVRVWGGGPQSGSRWSARSAARTNDLEAGEDPPHTDR